YFNRILKLWERAVLGALTVAMIIVACTPKIMHSYTVDMALIISAVIILVFFIVAKMKKKVIKPAVPA
ncbi:MAG: C4-dicarboxylate ABC transporter permease, partial [Sphaerochaeta sp.]|nr:C4-dicarboxylate ABC transporter permease [Sphaerochaeta sp.]